MSVDPDADVFLRIFRDESDARLDRMTGILLQLEAGSVAAPDAVDALFRDAHTIKGGAGMLELTDVRVLAHAVEDVLVHARASRSLPVELVDPLLRATARLREQIHGEQEPDNSSSDNSVVAELAQAGAVFVAQPDAYDGPDRRDGRGATRGDPELRMLRVPAAQIDRLLEVVGEAILHQRRLEHALADSIDDRLDVAEGLDLARQSLDDLKVTAIEMRTLPVRSIVGPLPRIVRDLAVATGKEADLVVHGADTPLDRVILERLADLLGHLLRNAVSHGLETPDERLEAGKPPRGVIEVRAELHGSFVEITVSDDGRGVVPSALEEAAREGSLVDVLARPGYSTAEEVTELSGRGVGLDAVKMSVEAFGGSLDLTSEVGIGTSVVLQLPLALSLLEALFFERGASVFGVPLSAVEEVVTITVGPSGNINDDGELPWRDRLLPVFDVAALVGAPAPILPTRSPALVLTAGGRHVVASCDALLGQAEVVVKPLGSLVGGTYLGAAIVGDGRVALLLEPARLVRGTRAVLSAFEVETRPGQKILVVEDSFTVRELQRTILEAAGYDVVTAGDGVEALAVLAQDVEIALVVTDFEMPEMDGLELTRAIRRSDAWAGLPVVVVSSEETDADHRRGFDAGADAYMSKRSYDQRALLDIVKRLVAR